MSNTEIQIIDNWMRFSLLTGLRFSDDLETLVTTNNLEIHITNIELDNLDVWTSVSKGLRYPGDDKQS